MPWLQIAPTRTGARWRSPRVWAVAAPGAVVVVAAGLWALPYLPVPPDRFTDVRVVNDLQQPAALRQCTHDGDRACASADPPGETWKAGESASLTVSTGFDNPYLVLVAGRVAGCLPMLFADESPEVVMLSSAAPCPQYGLPPGLP